MGTRPLVAAQIYALAHGYMQGRELCGGRGGGGWVGVCVEEFGEGGEGVVGGAGRMHCLVSSSSTATACSTALMVKAAFKTAK